jgi:hypothetical protein
MEMCWIITAENPESSEKMIKIFNQELHLATWILRFTILLQCAGVFLQLLSGGALEGMLFMEYGVEQATAKKIENMVALVFLFIGSVIFFRPRKILLLTISFLFFSMALLIQRQAGSPFTDWTVFAHAARIVAPLGLYLLVSNGFLSQKIIYYVLVMGLGITFITHGLEAISRHPYFLDYLITSANNLAGIELSQQFAERILQIIGSFDILIGVLIFVVRNKWLLLWLAFWGLVTAFSRITELGWGMYPEVLSRAAHFGIPIALIFLNRLTKRKTQGKISSFRIIEPTKVDLFGTKNG